MSTDPIRITLLTQADCGYCEHAKTVLAKVGHDYALTVDEVDLNTQQGRTLATTNGVLFAPGVLVDGAAFGYGRLSERRLRKELRRRTAPLR